MTKIEWSAEAASDLENIKNYIAQNSPSYAKIFIEKIMHAVERLADHPLSGRVVPEFEDPQFREIFHGNYRIIYAPVDDVIRIYAVVHGSRKLASDDLNPQN